MIAKLSSEAKATWRLIRNFSSSWASGSEVDGLGADGVEGSGADGAGTSASVGRGEGKGIHHLVDSDISTRRDVLGR